MSDKKEDKKEEKKEDAAAVELTPEEQAALAKKKKKKKIMIIAVVAIILIGGGIGAALTLGGGNEEAAQHKSDGHNKADSKHGEAAAEDCPPAEKKDGGHGKEEGATHVCGQPVYVDVPDLVVNLTSTTNRAHFVSVKATLELKSAADTEEVQANMPRLVDSFNTYLREMTKQDLDGSEGTERLKTEMMVRVNKILKPGQVTDILFKSLIVQ